MRLYRQLSLSSTAAFRKIAVQSVLEGIVAALNATRSEAAHAKDLLAVVWDMHASSDPGAHRAALASATERCSCARSGSQMSPCNSHSDEHAALPFTGCES